jgi:hypothetical protein
VVQPASFLRTSSIFLKACSNIGRLPRQLKISAAAYPFSPEETTPPKEEEMPPFDGLKMK